METLEPFNVNAPAIAAGIAAIEDAAHQERSREHNTEWLAWLTEEIAKLGLHDVAAIEDFLQRPDEGLLDENLALARQHFNLARLPARLAGLLSRFAKGVDD